MTGGAQYTHYAGFQGAIAARNALLPLSDPGTVGADRLPGCVFTSPEVARVGLTEEEAKAARGAAKVKTVSRDLGRVDRAVTAGEDAVGFIKLVYAAPGGAILGATVVGPSAGELISEISLAPLLFKAFVSKF